MDPRDDVAGGGRRLSRACVQREGFADVLFRGGRRLLRWTIVALLFPQVVGFVAFGAGWLTGLVLFVPPSGGFWIALLVASTIGTAVSAVWAAGEEIGWRGYMLIRLIDAGLPHPVLISGAGRALSPSRGHARPPASAAAATSAARQ